MAGVQVPPIPGLPPPCFLCQIALGLYAEDLLLPPGERPFSPRLLDLAYNSRRSAIVVKRVGADQQTPAAQSVPNTWDDNQQRAATTTQQPQARSPDPELPQLSPIRTPSPFRPDSEPLPSTSTSSGLGQDQELSPTSQFLLQAIFPELTTPQPTHVQNSAPPALPGLLPPGPANRVTDCQWETHLRKALHRDRYLANPLAATAEELKIPHCRVEKLHDLLVLVSHLSAGTVTVTILSGASQTTT